MSEDEKKQKFPYDSVMFLLVDKKRRIISTHNIKNRKEHLDLIKRAIDKGYILYHADVQKIGDKWYTCPQWIVDWESITETIDETHDKPEPKCEPDTENEQGVENEPKHETKLPIEISCPFCDKKMTSTPGRTLHVKSAHPEKYQEYIENK